MVLKFKVWRLQLEPRITKLKGKKRKRSVLVLRDENMKIIGIARSAFEESSLKARYVEYNAKAKLEDLVTLPKRRLATLQRERRSYRWVLVLRDKNGKIRRVAKTRKEQARLKRWYRKYNVQARLDQLLAVRRLKDHIRKVKAEVRRRGFTKQLSHYGIFQEPLCLKCGSKKLKRTIYRNGEHGFKCLDCKKRFKRGHEKKGRRYYCRYEVFRRDAWTQRDVAAMHDFLKKNKPKSAAGVFIFHANRLYVVGTDKVTQMGVETLGYKGERRNLDVD